MGNRAIIFGLALIVIFVAHSVAVADEIESVRLAKAAAADPELSAEEVLLKFVAAEKELMDRLGNASFALSMIEIHWQWATLLSAKSAFIRGRIELRPDLEGVIGPTAVAALRDAIEHYDAAAAGREATLRGMAPAEKSGEAGQQMSWQARRARFYACTAAYQLGVALPKGGTAREDQLQAAIGRLQDFVWDNEDNILGGYAYLYIGLAHQGLGDQARALEFLRTAAAAYPVPTRSDAENYGKWTDLYLQSYFKLAEMCNELGRSGTKDYQEAAVTILSTMEERVPDCWERQFGQLALIQRAQALRDLGRVGEAKAILERVVEEAGKLPETVFWRASTAFLAEQVLAQIAAEGVVPPTVAELFRAAEQKKAERKWVEAEQAFRAVIDACGTEEETRVFGIPSWMQVGECCYRDDRFEDAYRAYDQLLGIPEFAETEKAGDAAYFRYRAAAALAAQDRTPEAEELKAKARVEFVTGYPDHPRAIDLRYYLAADLLSEADGLRGKLEGPSLDRIYEMAIDNFGAVKPVSLLYARARARIVEARFKLGAYDQALEEMTGLLSFLDSPDHRTTDAERVANRLAAGAVATYYGALAAEKQGDWKRLLEILEGFEAKYPAEEQKGFRAAVEAARQRAQQNLEEAGK